MIYTYIDLLNSPIMGTFLWLQFQGHFFSVSESLLIVNNPNNPCQDKLACSINLREDLRYLAVTYFVVGVNSSKTLGTPTNLDIHHRSIVKGLKLGWKGLYVGTERGVCETCLWVCAIETRASHPCFQGPDSRFRSSGDQLFQ